MVTEFLWDFVTSANPWQKYANRHGAQEGYVLTNHLHISGVPTKLLCTYGSTPYERHRSVPYFSDPSGWIMQVIARVLCRCIRWRPGPNQVNDGADVYLGNGKSLPRQWLDRPRKYRLKVDVATSISGVRFQTWHYITQKFETPWKRIFPIFIFSIKFDKATLYNNTESSYAISGTVMSVGLLLFLCVTILLVSSDI